MSENSKHFWFFGIIQKLKPVGCTQNVYSETEALEKQSIFKLVFCNTKMLIYSPILI